MDNNGAETNKKWQKTFTKCPACGSKERFFEGIVKELKAEGKVPEGWNFCLDAKNGVIAEPQKIQLALVGTVFPAYAFETDICSNCGLIYVTRLERGEAKVRPQIIKPNREERRRMGNFNPLGKNNALLS